MELTVEQIVSELQLREHPEGGYYTEIYRSDGFIDSGDDEYPDGRNYSTSIYYLLDGGKHSHFHRIKSDEIWHHYIGSSLTIHILTKNGQYRTLHLGKEMDSGQKPQHIVPANTWFGVTVDEPTAYALCGCTVSPGFDFDDFELGKRNHLIQRYPEHEKIIKTLTRD